MTKIFIEENGLYSIDCTKAIWATDQLHEVYHEAGIHINDVDWLIESETDMFMVEYKNASIAGVAKPNAFNPAEDKKVFGVMRKFYDSLHYLNLIGKTKPVQYIYILEYPNGDSVSRKRLRNRLKKELPFLLQQNVGNGRKLIEKMEIVSIKEWNEDENYGLYPLQRVGKKQ